MAADPNNNMVFYTGGNYKDSLTLVMAVSKTTDGGTTWSRYLLTTTAGFTYALAVDPTNSNILYAGGNPALFKSTDGGTNWASSSSGLAGCVNSIVIHPTTTSTLYAGSSLGVFKSTDCGASWNNTGCTNINAVVIDPNSPNTIYAGTATGVYKSTTGGGNWATMNDGLFDLNVTSMGIHAGRCLYASTHSAGIFNWQTTEVKEEAGSSLRSVLSTHPNPAKGQVSVRYAVSSMSKVNLAIYDAQGRLVKNLASTVRKPGVYTATWNGLDRRGWQVPAGVYFIELATEQSKSIQKLILLR